MAALVGRRVRTTQPIQNPQIDGGDLFSGLVFAYTCGDEAIGYGEDGRNLIQYVNGGGTVLGIRVNTPTGTGVQAKTSSSYAFGPVQSSVKSGVYSLFAFGTGPASGIQSALDDDDGISRRFQFRINAGKVEFNPFYSGGNGNVISPAALSATDLATGFAMGATVNGTAHAIYQKGVKTVGATLPSTALTPNAAIAIAARKTGTTQAWLVGGLQVVAMWNRPLTDAEQASLADSPWQLFRSAPRRLWLAWSASSGTTTNVNPGAGTLALTGYAPMVAQSANEGVTPGAGALTLTGYAPSVTQSVTTNVVPAAGSLSLTGFAPTVARTANMNVAPAAGSLTLTGYAPTVTRTTSQAVQPGPGGLTLTGYAPLITQGVDNAPRVNVATIMRITTTNRVAELGAALNVIAPIRSTGPNVATIMSAGAVNCTAALGPASINLTAGFP